MRSWMAAAFPLLWSATVVGAVMLYHETRIRDGGAIVGLVESVVHDVLAPEAGRISGIGAAPGDRVDAGQRIAELTSTEVDAELAHIHGELDANRDLQILEERIAQIDQRRLLVEHGADRDRRQDALLQVEQLRHDEQIRLDVKKAEVAGLDQQIARLTAAQSAGLGHADELASLVTRRDALQRYVEESHRVLQVLDQRIELGTAGMATWDSLSADALRPPSGSDRPITIARLEARIAELTRRRAAQSVSSPCPGEVVTVRARPGDVVQRFALIASIRDSGPTRWVDAWLPAGATDVPLEQATVAIRSFSRADIAGTGVVTAIAGAYDAMPVEMQPRAVAAVPARRLRIRLDDGSRLMPGERVQVIITGSAEIDADGEAVLDAHPALLPQPIAVPPALQARTRFEASGLIWLHDLQRFLVISDDTGLEHDAEHSPWLFLMDEVGRIDPDPVVVSGIDAIRDLEGIAQRRDGTILLLASQSIDRHGRRPRDRTLLCEVRRTLRDCAVTRSVSLWPLIAALPDDALRALGLDPTTDRAHLALDIEGVAWLGDDLVLGIKEPIAADGAMIWILHDVDALFGGAALAPDQLARFITVPGGEGRANSGISDLGIAADGGLLMTFTGESAAYVLDPAQTGIVTPRRIAGFASGTPEGIAATSRGSIMVVCDGNAGNSTWLSWRTSP